MSYPKHVFLDTEVFTAQQYNFESHQLTAFVEAAKKRDVSLITTAPTIAEVQRHIKDRAEEALRQVELGYKEAMKGAPFLKKWERLAEPPGQKAKSAAARVGLQSLTRFLGKFPNIHLGYEGVDLAQVMLWYDQALPPFALGKKRKEFPDAFAIAIVSEFATREGHPIAVVSGDQDMGSACEHKPLLLHFSSLGQLTEAMLDEEGGLAPIKEGILSDLSLLASAVEDDLILAGVEHAISHYVLLETTFETKVKDVNVVGVSLHHASLAFTVYVRAKYTMAERGEGSSPKLGQMFTQIFRTGGTAKVKLDPASHKIQKVTFVEVNDYVFHATAIPALD